MKCLYCTTEIPWSHIDEESSHATCPKCGAEYGIDWSYDRSIGTAKPTLEILEDE